MFALDYCKEPYTNYSQESLAVDRGLQALRIGKRILHLAPRSFHVLCYLFEHQDRVVAKSELLEKLWPQASGQHALRQEIYSLRRSLAAHGLGDCIRTVAHYGYRFQEPSFTGILKEERTDLTEFQKRALAAAAQFEQRADTRGWLRALFWYEQLTISRAELPAVHIGALRSLLQLLIRSAVRPQDAVKASRRHLTLLESFHTASAQKELLEIAVGGLLGAEDGSALTKLGTLSVGQQNDGELEQVRAFLFLSMCQVDKALDAQRAVISWVPQSIEAHLHYGEMLLLGRNLEAADRQFRFITQLLPDNSDALEGIGLAELARGNPQKAEELLRKVNTPKALAIRCVAHTRLDEAAKGREDLCELEATRTTAYVPDAYLVRCYDALNESSRASMLLSASGPDAAMRRFHLEDKLWCSDLIHFPYAKQEGRA